MSHADKLQKFYDSYAAVKCNQQILKLSEDLLEGLTALLIPERAQCVQSEDFYSFKQRINRVGDTLFKILEQLGGQLPAGMSAEDIVEKFKAALPDLKEECELDLDAMFAMDPAAQSRQEVAIIYPGYLAIVVYRVAHWVYRESIPLLPRILSGLVHQKTGIDIHPGAEIGHSFAIDHGTGVVIGQTCVIGKNVRIYQGVNLGSRIVRKTDQNVKRHPTVGDNVTIYASAVILGGDTEVGSDSIIGGNVFLLESVPPGSKVYYQSPVKTVSKAG